MFSVPAMLTKTRLILHLVWGKKRKQKEEWVDDLALLVTVGCRGTYSNCAVHLILFLQLTYFLFCRDIISTSYILESILCMDLVASFPVVYFCCRHVIYACAANLEPNC